MKKDTISYLIFALAGLVVVGLIYWVVTADSSTSINTENPLELTQEDWVKGPQDAKVTLIEYADFQCPACSQYSVLVKAMHEAYPDDLQIVFRHFPLIGLHSNAMISAVAAEAAGKQGKFWEMHDILFERQSEWSSLRSPKQTFADYAEELGMNRDQFLNDMDNGETEKNVSAGLATARALDLGGTPSFFLNGVAIDNPSGPEAFIKLIDQAINTADMSSDDSEDIHIHADFMVYLNGRAVDFEGDDFQDLDNKLVQLKDGNGEMIHIYKRGVTLNEIFSSLGMSLNDTCLTTADEKEYCNDESKTLKVFVNESSNLEYGDYVIRDLDRILISFGSETSSQLQKQKDRVKDESCVYSGSCPERGESPENQ